MKRLTILAAAMPLVLAGCQSKPAAPVKREPGSWSQKIEVLKLEGKDAPPQAKAQLQAMFDAMGRMSVCITPEAAAREDVAKNLEANSGAAQGCTFERRTVDGETVDLAGTCGGANGGKKVRIEAKGTSGATAQDITMTVQPLGADGKPEGVMQMHMTATRSGACKPGDITPPAPPAGNAG